MPQFETWRPYGAPDEPPRIATVVRMTSEATKGWIEAAKILVPNPAAQVLCPACGETYLAVQDTQPFGEKKERILSCVKCGAREFILMGA